MRISALATAAFIVALTIAATAASACQWNDASAQASTTTVASASGSDQPATTQQTPPASAN